MGTDQVLLCREVIGLRGRGAQIESVLPGSPAKRKGLESGDVILTINRQAVRDLVDYMYLSAEDEILLSVLKKDGSTRNIHIERKDSEEWGITFNTPAFDGMMCCANRCLFCFIDQLPTGMRPSLYDKDDDYRWSFFSGNFITLTNLSDRELNRIIEYRLSPLYVSVHTTDPELREYMLGNRRAGRILQQLEMLARGGIRLHLQLVLCPGINDGAHLDKTLGELFELGPNILSIGLVPVGLTGFRKNLSHLRVFTRAEAAGLIKQAGEWQYSGMKNRGSRLVFLADEFYLLAGEKIPPAEAYEGYPQLENGIGLTRKFLDEYEKIKPLIPKRLAAPRRILVLTGELGHKVLRCLIEEMSIIEGLDIELRAVKNRFFAGEVKVTGLLTGSDIIGAMEKDSSQFDMIIIPEVVLREGTGDFLDGYRIDQLERETGCPIRVSPMTARGLLEAVMGFRVGKKIRKGIPYKRYRGCIEQ